MANEGPFTATCSKNKNPTLAAVMGATLATKRSSAERLTKDVDKDALVIECYANPFRTYPLKDDYTKFKELFEKRNVDCFIFNTGHYLDKKVPKEVTLKALEDIVEGKAEFKAWGSLSNMEYLEIEGFPVNMEDKAYIEKLNNSIDYRIQFLESLKGKRDELPEETLDVLYKVKKEICD